MEKWTPIGLGEIAVVAQIGVIVDPDRKFGYAALKVDAITDCCALIRLYTKSDRGLRLKKAKKADVSRIYKCLVGKTIHFRRFRSPDGRIEMYFPIEPTKKELIPLKKETEKLLGQI